MASNNQGGNKGKQGGNQQSGDTSNRGFASMDPERQREIASEGGRAAHASGNAHEFTSEEARRAGSLSHGGAASAKSPASPRPAWRRSATGRDRGSCPGGGSPPCAPERPPRRLTPPAKGAGDLLARVVDEPADAVANQRPPVRAPEVP